MFVAGKSARTPGRYCAPCLGSGLQPILPLMSRRIPHPLLRSVALSAFLACAGCGAKEVVATDLPAAVPAATPPVVVKTYACKVCGAVSSKPNRIGRCPGQKDGGPCRWKEIPRTN